MDLGDDLAAPQVVDRETWQTQIDVLRAREKAHTKEGDQLAAARRRLPMVEVDGAVSLTGANGPVTLLETFEGRRQLVAYFHMWHPGQPAKDQCEGCTFFSEQVRELAYLHARDVTFAVFCDGPIAESERYRAFMEFDVPWYATDAATDALLAGRWFGMLVSYLRTGDRVFETYWTTGRGVEAMANSYGLLDRTVYGRQEVWEDSPAGWPQPFATTGEQFRTDGRPSAQWSRLAKGRSDDLS